ncbi:hypothetical protein CALCODRAFT_504063 [Calocera cornea HHB12733]|uniref:Uncharacterized protein n=1 Tax=Calocera cornea HHB12733 TaxID=1353952 RepID=A0A165CL52_9BASI|nr:hypothetical protein CALCODRAFT_504063 [Calocera cornea HHB12733]
MCWMNRLYTRWNCGHTRFDTEYYFECGQRMCALSRWHVTPCPTNCATCYKTLRAPQNFTQMSYDYPCPDCQEALARGGNPAPGFGRDPPRAPYPPHFSGPVHPPDFAHR